MNSVRRASTATPTQSRSLWHELAVAAKFVAGVEGVGRELAWRAEEVFGWGRQGVITTTIAARYPLKDAGQAQKNLTSRRLAGKLLIDVGPSGNA